MSLLRKEDKTMDETISADERTALNAVSSFRLTWLSLLIKVELDERKSRWNAIVVDGWVNDLSRLENTGHTGKVEESWREIVESRI